MVNQIVHNHNSGIYSETDKERLVAYMRNNEFKLKQDRNPIKYINHRIKSPESILMKMKRNNVEMNMEAMRENISDIAGVRVICSYITDVYLIADMLIRQDDIKLIRTKDYISNPKESGYRSLHLVIEIPIFLSNAKQMVRVEVQIRTIAMDFWASLEHQLRYKMNMNIPDDIREQLKTNAESVYQLDLDMQRTYEEIEKLNKLERMNHSKEER